MSNNEFYNKIRNYTDDEIEKFLEEFYGWAYVDGCSGNVSDWECNLKYTVKRLAK